MSFPRSIDEVSTAWLSSVFGAEPDRADASYLAGGMLADTYRLQLSWGQQQPHLPDSAIVKLPTQIDAQRQIALDSGLYRKEIEFYRQIAAHIPARIPKAYAAFDDGTPDAAAFLILMEDLGAEFKAFDQVSDQPAAPHVAKFCDSVAAIHGSMWNADVLGEDWISSGGHYVFPLDAMCRQSEGKLEPLRAAWRKYYDDDVFDGIDPAVAQLTEILTSPQSKPLLDHITQLLDSRPKTLLHGDLRCDNLFRTRDTDAENVELAIIDWQVIHAGPPGPDFTQAWQHSLPLELRRRDVAMLERYHRRLVELTPAAAQYTLDMLLEDYRLGYLLYYMMNVAMFPTILPATDELADGPRMLALYRQAMRLMQTALADHGCLGLAARLQAEI